MNNLTIINQNGTLLVDSREVAERTGKEHKNLLRDIKGYVKVIKQSSNLSSDNFFIESFYTNENNQNYPRYLLTRKGCDMVANKMTGEKGILFTAEYVTEFEKMQKEITQTNIPKLSKEIQAIFMLDEKQQALEHEVKDLKDNMPLFNIDCEELQAAVRKQGVKIMGGKSSQAYKDNSLRGKIYSDIQREVKRQFGLQRSYKALKSRQKDAAIEIIEKYVAPMVLQDEIALLNNQFYFDKSI